MYFSVTSEWCEVQNGETATVGIDTLGLTCFQNWENALSGDNYCFYVKFM